MRPASSAVIAGALALALGAAAIGADMAAGGAVAIKNFAFGPTETTVHAGTTVTWKNLDGEPHTVVSVDGVFRSSALDQGEAYAWKATKPGTYRYMCGIHPNMRGTIVVK
jgi:plastocyanin